MSKNPKKYVWIGDQRFIPKFGTFREGDEFPATDDATVADLLKRKFIKPLIVAKRSKSKEI